MRAGLTLNLLFAAAIASVTSIAAQEQSDPFQVHVSHVLESFKGTPKQQGLLPVAVEEAKIATHHAALAAKAPDSLDQMKLHAGHVIHALDPAVEVKGPGLGYGVKKAAAGVAQHVELAAKAPTASSNAKTQALYVSRWANNVVKWSDEAIAVAQRIRSAASATEAAKLMPDLTSLTEQLTVGIPAVGRFNEQGGLQQAQERMELLKKGDDR
jgi:hypothetical protein